MLYMIKYKINVKELIKMKNKYTTIKAKDNPELSIDINKHGILQMFGMSNKSFKELKKVCDYYGKENTTEWVNFCGITIFKN